MEYEGTWKCTEGSCQGTITWSVVKGQLTQKALYPTGFGPSTPGLRFHNCPVAAGLPAEQMREHPLAQEVT